MQGLVDDARHSVVGKSRALSQSSLDVFARAAGEGAPLLARAAFGRYEVREVEVKTALTKCAMPGEPWSLNPYTGCSHDCVYCYVPDVAHLERAKWASYVIVKRNLPTVLAHEVKRKEPRDVFLSSATDPYQPAERDHRITERSLEVLSTVDWPLGVLSRSPLMRRDVPLFKRFSQISLGMSVPTLDDEARRIVEPGAPPIEGRLRTLRALADEGFDTFANLMPTYPLTGGLSPRDVAETFRDAGVRKVLGGAWRYLDGVAPFLRERVQGTPYEPFARQVADPLYYARLLRRLGRAFQEAGVAFRYAGG